MNKSLVCTLTLHYISDNLISCTFHHCRFFFGFPKDFSISFDAKFILSRSKKLPSQALHQKLKLNSFPLNIMCKRFLALVKAELQHQFPHHFWIWWRRSWFNDQHSTTQLRFKISIFATKHFYILNKNHERVTSRFTDWLHHGHSFEGNLSRFSYAIESYLCKSDWFSFLRVLIHPGESIN